MNCKKCNSVISEGQKFCTTCGVSVQENDVLLCTKCGAEIAKSVIFCGNCGARIEKEKAPIVAEPIEVQDNKKETNDATFEPVIMTDIQKEENDHISSELAETPDCQKEENDPVVEPVAILDIQKEENDSSADEGGVKFTDADIASIKKSEDFFAGTDVSNTITDDTSKSGCDIDSQSCNENHNLPNENDNERKDHPKFCIHCGTHLDSMTGKCNNPSCKQNMIAKDVPHSNVSTQKKKKKGRSPAVVAITSIVLSIILFVTSLCAVLIFDVRNIVNTNNVPELLDHVVSNVDFVKILKSTNTIDTKDMNMFYDRMYSIFGVTMDDDSLSDFIQKSSLAMAFDDDISEFCRDFFNGDGKLTVSRKNFERFLKDNSDVIESEFGERFNSVQISRISGLVFEEDKVDIITTSTIRNNYSDIYYFITMGFSYVTMVYFVVFSLLIVILMAKNSLKQMVYGVGATFITIGGITTCIAVLSKTVFWKILFSDYVIAMVIGEFFFLNIIGCIFLLLFGILVLVVGNVITILTSKKKA